MLRLDLRDFFPSTGAGRVRDRLRHLGWDEDSAALPDVVVAIQVEDSDEIQNNQVLFFLEPA